MCKMRVRPRPEGFKRLRTKIESLALTPGDLQGPVLRLLDSVHNQQVGQAFLTRGASVATGPWPPWSPRYARWRAKYHHRIGHRMMYVTGTLFAKAARSNHASHIAEWLGKMRFRFGYVDDVGYWHQHGTGKMPVRSVIDKTEKQKHDFVAAFVDFYRKRIRQVLR